MKKNPNTPNYAALSFLTFAILLTSFTLVAAKTPVVITYANSKVLGDSVTTDSSTSPEPSPTPEMSGDQPHPQNPQMQIEPSSTNSNLPKEIQTQGAGQRVTIKSEDNGVIHGEFQKQGKTYKFQVINGHMRIETQSGDGKFLPATPKDETAARDLLSRQEIKVSTAGGRLQLERNGITAGTDLPISVRVGDPNLSLKTPQGDTVLKTPPDVAVENLIKSNLSQPGSSNSAVGLTLRDGKPVYSIQGEKQTHLFGVIPITLPTTTYVELNNGQVVAQDQSLLTSILRFFSR